MERILKLIHIILLIFSVMAFVSAQKDLPILKEKPESGEMPKKRGGKLKSFDSVVKDYEKIEGLFNLYWNEDMNKVYLEIQRSQLDEIYLCNVTRNSGDAYLFDSGAMHKNFPFFFKKVGERIQFVHKNVRFRAEPDAAINRAVDNSFSNSIIGSARLASEPHSQYGSLLIDAKSLFIQDITMVSYLTGIWKRKYSLDRENSYFNEVKSFELNTEIDVILHFKSGKPKSAYTLPDSRSMLHRYHYSISQIPETDYQPRLADDRVGHFMTMYQDYTSLLKDSPYVRYINRWHLEKAEPKFELSKPKKPIVYWLENTIPVEYRDAVTEGTLLWNDAFEKIGIKEAIEVRQMPDDAEWDPADARYNTIRWIIKPGSGYAVGPSKANPFSGELYDADIRVSSDYVRFWFREYDEFITPLSSDGEDVQTGFDKWWKGEEDDMDDPSGCNYADEKMHEMAFAWNLLSGSRGYTDKDLEDFIHDGLVDLIVHEVGHTLGLRHNFKASSIYTPEQLKSAEFTEENGVTGSVMDYNPINLSPDEGADGNYFQTQLGPYDYWAIEYAYGFAADGESEKMYLENIAGRCTEPLLQYGTDEDASSSSRGIDPQCTRYDLSSDPFKFYQDRITLTQRLWDTVLDNFEKEGERYQKIRQVFTQGVSEYVRGMVNITKFIGGIYHRRDHIGDENGRPPFEVVAPEKQREAVHFLTSKILSRDAFQFSSELLNKLAPERMADFKGTIYRMRRIDFPIHNMVFYIQANTLFSMYSPLRMHRMLDNELRFSNKRKKYTLSEMFKTVRDEVWVELKNRENINSFRRELQRIHLRMLIIMAVKSNNNFPRDAISLARADLEYLKTRMDRLARSQSLDDYTQAHIAENLSKIEAALSAQIPKEF